MLGQLEGALLWLMRVVMIVLVLFTLFTFAMWGIDAARPAKTAAEVAQAQSTRDWSALQISAEELKKTTYADFGYGDVEQALNDGKLAADSAVVAAFAEVDSTVRAVINRNPAARQKLEADNSEVGLAATLPLPELVKAVQAKEREGFGGPAVDAAAEAVTAATNAAVAAAASAIQAADDEEAAYRPQPTSIGEALLNQTRSVISSHGYDAGRAFALGAPAAFKTLLADPQVQAGIAKQTASTVVSNLMINYYMAFSTQVNESESAGQGWLARLVEPSNLLVFTILVWSFVFMMMIVVFLRVERHLRAMAQEGKALAGNRTPQP